MISPGWLSAFTISNTPYLWNLQTGEQSPASVRPATPTPDNAQETLKQLAQSFYSSDPTRRINSVTGVPGNQVMVVAINDQLDFWDINNRLPLASVRYFGRVLGFSTDGTVMMTKTDETIWLWGIPG